MKRHDVICEAWGEPEEVAGVMLLPLGTKRFRLLERRRNRFLTGNPAQSEVFGVVEFIYVLTLPLTDIPAARNASAEEWEERVDAFLDPLTDEDIGAMQDFVKRKLERMNQASVESEDVGKSERALPRRA